MALKVIEAIHADLGVQKKSKKTQKKSRQPKLAGAI
jgi:hypothetical protein